MGPMDAFLLKQVIAELAVEIPGALVSKVHQPGEKEIVLELWGRGEKRLLLSADPELCRIHLTTRKTPNPPSPPRFCQFLRKHLEGMRIAGFSVAPYDRSVRIDFLSGRPDAEHAKTSLYAELFGRHANLIYVDGDGTILEPLRTVSDEESRIRQVVPGIPYRPLPRPARVFLPEVTRDDATRIFAERVGGNPEGPSGKRCRPRAGSRARGGNAGTGKPRCAVRSLARPCPPVRGERLLPRDRDALRREAADPPLPLPGGGVRRLPPLPHRQRGGRRLLRGSRAGAGNRRPPAAGQIPDRRAPEEGAPQAGKRRRRRGAARRGAAGDRARGDAEGEPGGAEEGDGFLPEHPARSREDPRGEHEPVLPPRPEGEGGDGDRAEAEARGGRIRLLPRVARGPA